MGYHCVHMEGFMIGVSDFFKSNSKHVLIPHEVLKQLVEDYFKHARLGYRDGVMLVPIPPMVHTENGEIGVCTDDVIELHPDDVIVGQFTPRVEGEEPRVKTFVVREGNPPLAKYVDVVIYSRETLQEGGEPHTGEDWDIIAVLGRPTLEHVPMDPNTMLSNHYQVSGGTSTHWSAEEFEQELRKSFLFWRKHARASFLGA
jgi:hypothetical protein